MVHVLSWFPAAVKRSQVAPSMRIHCSDEFSSCQAGRPTGPQRL